MFKKIWKYVWLNFVCHRNTFVLRKPGESPNDRNDRAIRRIAQFYNEHLKQQSKKKF